MARKRLRPVINTTLGEAIREVGWTLAEVAKAIDAVGAENGITLTYGAAAVAHWLAGVTPRAETVPVAVEAFTRRSGRSDLTSADLGWPVSPGKHGGDPWQGDPVVWLTHLGRSDMLNRRTTLVSGLYSLAALSVPAVPERVLSRTGHALGGGPGDVTRIYETTRRLSDIDDLYGGGHARAAVAGELAALPRDLLSEVRW